MTSTSMKTYWRYSNVVLIDAQRSLYGAASADFFVDMPFFILKYINRVAELM